MNGCPDCPDHLGTIRDLTAEVSRLSRTESAMRRLAEEKDEQIAKILREVRLVKDLLVTAKGELNSARVYIDQAQAAFQKFTQEELCADLMENPHPFTK